MNVCCWVVVNVLEQAPQQMTESIFCREGRRDAPRAPRSGSDRWRCRCQPRGSTSTSPRSFQLLLVPIADGDNLPEALPSTTHELLIRCPLSDFLLLAFMYTLLESVDHG